MEERYFRGNPNIEDPTAGDTSNPDVEMPTDTDTDAGQQPVPPGRSHPPVEMPPDQPGMPEDQSEPVPIGDPQPAEPTRLV